MGGTVEVSSVPGRLTVFTVRLGVPAADARACLSSTATTSSVRARRSPASCCARRCSARATLVRADRRARPPEGRALPAHRLVQAARDARQARLADRRREATRGRHLVGRERRAGVAWSAAAEGIACRVFMWQTANPLKVAATRGYGAEVDLEADGRRRVPRPPARARRGDGRGLRPPVRRPGAPRPATGRSGSRSLEDVPGVRRRRRSGRRRRADRRRRHRASRARRTRGRRRAGGRGVADRGARGRRARADRAAVDRRRARARPSPASTPGRRRERVDEVVLVSEAEIEEAFRFLYARAKLACEPAGAASTAALLAGKIALEPGETVVAVVSGGNAAPETASAILARR